MTNLLGWKIGTGYHWTRMRVRELRSRLDLPACDSTQPAWLTAKGAARHLGISPAYAGLLLKRGTVPGAQLSRAACGGSIPGSSTRRNCATLSVRSVSAPGRFL